MIVVHALIHSGSIYRALSERQPARKRDTRAFGARARKTDLRRRARAMCVKLTAARARVYNSRCEYTIGQARTASGSTGRRRKEVTRNWFLLLFFCMWTSVGVDDVWLIGGWAARRDEANVSWQSVANNRLANAAGGRALHIARRLIFLVFAI